jgi:hypothetical protein
VYICATKSAMAVFNNLSHLPEWLSDTLCVVTEGSGDSRRELYTDEDESLIFARAPVMLAAVENVVARGDLADRTLYVTLAAVPEDERVPEDEFLARVEKDAPAILGALLTGLSVGLKKYPTLKLGALPRMAAFGKWGAACETAFWKEGTFLEAHRANAASATEDVLEADAVVMLFRSFMEDKDIWRGTMTQLLDALVDIVKAPLRAAEATYQAACNLHDAAGRSRWGAVVKEERDKSRDILGKRWPSNPRTLSGRLKKVGPQLRRAGILIEWPSGRRYGRVVTVINTATPEESANFASSPSSPSSGQDSSAIPEDDGETGGRWEDAEGTQEEDDAGTERTQRGRKAPEFASSE